MKCRFLALIAAVCLTLAGCGTWMDGNFASVTPHEEHTRSGGSADMSAANYAELLAALESLVAGGREKGLIYVGEYDQTLVDKGMENAVARTLTFSPLGAYAVEDIHYELGSNGGKPAIAVEITYLHGRAEILKIQQVSDMEAAAAAIRSALAECESGIVLYIERYDELDIGQLVLDYADEYPQYVMEVPEVASGIYPERGTARILELKFTYQNSRDSLRQMQSHVATMFDAAELYISSDDDEGLKLSQLYAFVMERFDYQLDTSITPAYSLLRHGVGDSRAFATVYAAMCRQSDLECHMVTGTRNGEPWYWNIVRDGENYFHVDLLRCSDLGGFREFTDGDMTGYVWDYSAYPECKSIVQAPLEPTEAPPEETTEDTLPPDEIQTTPAQ